MMHVSPEVSTFYNANYLYRTFQSFQFDGGIWGIFRVAPAYQPPPTDPCYCPKGSNCIDLYCPTTTSTN